MKNIVNHMFDICTVRIFIGVYVILAAIVIWLIWINAAANNALSNAGILFAALLPVLIAVIPYLKQESLETHLNLSLFYDSKDNEVIQGEMLNEYESSYFMVFANMHDMEDQMKGDSIDSFAEKNGLNLLEKGFVQMYQNYFSNHWDLEPKYGVSPIGEKMSWQHSELPVKLVEFNELKKIFKHNPIINSNMILTPQSVAIPENSNLLVTQDGNIRKIVIKDSVAEMTIELRYSGFGVTQQGVLGVIPRDSEDMNRYYAIEYGCNIKLKFARGKSNTAVSEKYRNWFRNLSNIYGRLDWKTIKEHIDKSIAKSSTLKVFDIDEKLDRLSNQKDQDGHHRGTKL